MNPVKLVWFILLLSAVCFTWSDAQENNRICQSAGCHWAAENILKNLDRNVDPCEDFFQFACGNYNERDGYESGLDRMILAVNKTLEKISSKHSYFIYLKEYMEQCHNMNEAEEHESLKAFMKYLRGAHLIDPEVEFDPPSEFSLVERAFELLPFGTDYFSEISVEIGSSGESYWIQPYSSSEEKLKFHEDLNISESEKEELEAFHAELREPKFFNGTNILDESPELTYKSYPDYTLEEWTARSSFNMEKYVTVKMGRHLTTEDKKIINIRNYNYFNFLLKTFEENRKLVLDYQLVNMYHKIKSDSYKTCFELAMNDMYILIEALVTEKFHLDFVKSTSENMVMDIRTEFKLMFANARWVTQETREKVIEGINDLKAVLVHYNKPFSRKQLHSFYKHLNTHTKSFFELRLRVGRLNAHIEFEDTTGNIKDLLYFKRRDGYTDIGQINAFYKSGNNEIYIPYPVIGKPLVVKDTPPFVNYAGLGNWVGHEIGHGIDYFLTQTKDKEYESIHQCFVTQYNGFVEPLTNLRADGLRTLGENVADYYGALATYKAAFSHDHRDWRGLPGLEDFNIRQQFWMHWAGDLCHDFSKDYIEFIMKTDSHSLDRFRINGPLQNLVEFSRDFQCSSDAKMNSEKRCVGN